MGTDEVDITEEHCAQEPHRAMGCSPYFNELAEILMGDEGLEMPNTIEEAQDLYNNSFFG